MTYEEQLKNIENPKKKWAEPDKPKSYREYCIKEKSQLEADGKMVEEDGTVRSRYYG